MNLEGARHTNGRTESQGGKAKEPAAHYSFAISRITRSVGVLSFQRVSHSAELSSHSAVGALECEVPIPRANVPSAVAPPPFVAPITKSSQCSCLTSLPLDTSDTVRLTC